MSGFEALRQGLQAARRGWRYVTLVWLADLVLAVLLALPFILAFDAAAAPTGTGEVLAARFDERFFAELAAANPAVVSHWDLRLALATAAAVLLHGFLAGGLIEALARRGARHEAAPPTVRALVSACLPRAGRMIAISVIAALGLAVVGALLQAVLGARLRETAVTSERTRLALSLAPGVVHVLFIAVVATWADLARACAVLGELEVVPAIARGARVLWRRAGALVAMGLAAFALQGAALVCFVSLDAAAPQGRWGGIVLMIAAAQVLMLWRHGVRVAVVVATARLCRDDLTQVCAGPVAEGEAAPAAGVEVAAPEAP